MKAIKLVHLGWIIGKITKQTGYSYLYLMSPSDEGERGYIPAESITLNGEENLKALRDALLEMFPLGEK